MYSYVLKEELATPLPGWTINLSHSSGTQLVVLQPYRPTPSANIDTILICPELDGFVPRSGLTDLECFESC